MASSKRDLLPGTLDMLILKTLSVSPMHGYGIAQHIKRLSRDVLQVDEGSLYPALQRLRQRGWLKAEWRQTGLHPRCRANAGTRHWRQHGDLLDRRPAAVPGSADARSPGADPSHLCR